MDSPIRARLADLQIEILERVARGEPAEATLAALCTSAEALIPDAVFGVTVLDRAARVFERAIFPSIPGTFSAALKGARVAERPGSCALAVYQGTTVTSEDIATDVRFQAGWKALSLEHGIVSIQSRPLRADDGHSLGTLVIGFRRPRLLSAPEEEIAEAAARLAGIALMRHRTELQQELLVAELQHRIRNLFSAIGAVVYSTLKAYPSAKDFRKIFDGRLAALSRAHALALETSDRDMRALLTSVLAPYSIDHQIQLAGPAFTLSPEAAVAFSLATHELATNATKYGALSQSGGRLAIRWDLRRDEQGEDRLELEWKESDGPLVPEAGRSGFGRFTIERSLAHAVDGAVAMEFDPAGLICRISAPISARLGGRTN